MDLLQHLHDVYHNAPQALVQTLTTAERFDEALAAARGQPELVQLVSLPHARWLERRGSVDDARQAFRWGFSKEFLLLEDGLQHEWPSTVLLPGFGPDSINLGRQAKERRCRWPGSACY